MDPQKGGKALMVDRCGTSGYIAPEVGSKNSLVGPEIDMWAFGVMLYEMCTAYKPTKLCNYRYGKSNQKALIISLPYPWAWE
jgi:serine/threonine protein kinase